MGIGSRLRAKFGSGSDDTPRNPKPETAAQGPKTDEEDETDEDPVSLFECPMCETVYIAIEKARCSQCEVIIDEPQPALSPVA